MGFPAETKLGAPGKPDMTAAVSYVLFQGAGVSSEEVCT